jgi:hypothetical protein
MRHERVRLKQKFYRRLTELEGISRARAEAERPDGTIAAREKVLEYLRGRGIEQGPAESLMETFARALGIGCRELRDRLNAHASGVLYID